MSRTPVYSKAFRKDFKRLERSGRYDLGELRAMVEALASDQSLSPARRDHALTGNWIGFRECHVRPDWLLIYRLEPERVVLVRTGSHAELFE